MIQSGKRSVVAAALMNRKVKKYLWLGAGWGFILLGIAGLFLPVLQGILFIAIGLVLLSTEYAWAHRTLDWLKKRFPRAGHHVDRAHSHVRRWRGEDAGGDDHDSAAVK